MPGRHRQGHVGRLRLVSRHRARRRLLPALAPSARRRAARSGCTRRRTTSTSSTGGSTRSRSRCRPSVVSATTGKAGPFRHTNCRPCPHKAQCKFYWDITKRPRLVDLYARAESADGYLRDGCVFREDVNIFDTMNAIVKYSTGATMSYSLNACMPIEGYRLAFNGTRGRLEVRDYERQPYPVPGETEIHVIKNFGAREKVEIPHGGRRARRRRRPAARPDLPRRRRCRPTCGCPTRAPARCPASPASPRARAWSRTVRFGSRTSWARDARHTSGMTTPGGSLLRSDSKITDSLVVINLTDSTIP